MPEPKFINGLIVKRHEKAPEYVICALSFKADEFTKYLAENQSNGWLNVDVKLSKGGKYYASLNDYKQSGGKPKVVQEEDNQAKVNNMQKDEVIDYPAEDINPEDIPF